MGRVYYNKLIRDNIPDKIQRQGETFNVRVLEDDQEFEQELLKKVIEESTGLSRITSREEFLQELPDLLEVIDALKSVYSVTDEEVREARSLNRGKKGGFAKRLFLHWSSDETYTSNETPQGTKHTN